MKMISVVIPENFDQQKKMLGLTWRGVIARGLNAEKYMEEMRKYRNEYEELRESNEKLLRRFNRVMKELQELKSQNI